MCQEIFSKIIHFYKLQDRLRSSRISPQTPSCFTASCLTGWGFPQKTAGMMKRVGCTSTTRQMKRNWTSASVSSSVSGRVWAVRPSFMSSNSQPKRFPRPSRTTVIPEVPKQNLLKSQKKASLIIISALPVLMQVERALHCRNDYTWNRS